LPLLVDESGAALTPPVRRTWAPVGHTPILRHRMRGRKRLSMAGVCCYRPDASDARLAFHLREGAYDTQQLIPVVVALGRLVGGDAPGDPGVGQPARPHQLGDAGLAGRLGLPRFDGQSWWLGQATCVTTSSSVAVSNSSGVM
jgi:hypothetical protein